MNKDKNDSVVRGLIVNDISEIIEDVMILIKEYYNDDIWANANLSDLVNLKNTYECVYVAMKNCVKSGLINQGKECNI